MGLAGERQAEPLQAQLRKSGRNFLFEGGLAGRNKEQPVQFQFLHGRLRDEQMAEMNRVERTAIESKPLHGKNFRFARDIWRWKFTAAALKMVDIEIYWNIITYASFA